jgi:hypothetical protein
LTDAAISAAPAADRARRRGARGQEKGSDPFLPPDDLPLVVARIRALLPPAD